MSIGVERHVLVGAIVSLSATEYLGSAPSL